MKDHTVNATNRNGFDLSHDSLDKFLGIIMLLIINSRKSIRDYWSSKMILGCPLVQNTMSRNKFFTIKSKLKFYTDDDRTENDKVRKIKRLYNMFRKNAQQFGWFSHMLSEDEVMVKYFGRPA